MPRIDVHNHLLPAIDDGCRTFEDSLTCVRTMMAHGYDRFFLTPHMGTKEFGTLTPAPLRRAVARFRRRMAQEGVSAAFRAGGELRLSPRILEWNDLSAVPTYGGNTSYCLVDLWEPDWPPWADAAMAWLQGRGLTVILAHPERMKCLQDDPGFIEVLARRGILFQGNLGPLGGSESDAIRLLAERFLQDGRYFLLGSDCHRPEHLPTRLAGLQRALELVGSATLETLTTTNASQLWV